MCPPVIKIGFETFVSTMFYLSYSWTNLCILEVPIKKSLEEKSPEREHSHHVAKFPHPLYNLIHSCMFLIPVSLCYAQLVK